MTQKTKTSSSSRLARIFRWFLLAILIVAAAVIGANFEPLSDFITEQVALLTNSRLPDSSSRLAFSLTTPRDLVVTFDEETKGVVLQWSESSWRPSRPQNRRISYEVSVFSPGDSIISSLSTPISLIAVKNLSGYLGQNLKFTVRAVGAILIGEHEYDFQSEAGEFRWIMPVATPTPIPTATFTPSNTPTPTATFTPSNTPTPTPTRLPSSDSRLAFTLSAPGNLQSTVTSSGDIIVEWQAPRWSPRKPSDPTRISYKVTALCRNSARDETKSTDRTSVPFNLKKCASNQQIRFQVEAVAEIRIDGHKYEIRSQAAEGAALYVPAYDYMLERDETDSRLPGYCSIGYSLNRGRGYDLAVAYYGRTYEWYVVDVFGPDGRELDIYATRLGGSGDSRAYYQRYSDITLKPGVYTARIRELDPRRIKTFAFVINDQGDYSLRLGGSGC